jgi:hypothetical protein
VAEIAPTGQEKIIARQAKKPTSLPKTLTRQELAFFSPLFVFSPTTIILIGCLETKL